LKKFAKVKKIIAPSDPRLKSNQEKKSKVEAAKEAAKVREVQEVASSLYFRHNTALVPPYQVLTLDLVKSMMDCLYAEAVPCITDCVLAELEKLGPKHRVALRIARDPRFKRLKCDHKGTYADDCLVERVNQHRCYLVATCDKGLKVRIRKIPGVPIMYIAQHKYVVEQLPEAYGQMF
jgi:U3 small nucleolar RNA-associated protein 24